MAFADEREAIAGVLEFAGRFLEYLLTHLDPNDKPLFDDAWRSETKPQLGFAIRMLRGKTVEEDIRRRAQEIYEERGREEGREFEDWLHAEGEFREPVRDEGWLHSFLRRAGLLGKSLKLKLQYLANAAMNGWGKKLLDLQNKFLGSLAKGFPGAEQVKEFKEWLEGLLNEPEKDPGILPIYKQGGSDPFCLLTL